MSFLRSRPWILLLIVCFGTLVAGIGQVSLFEPDEPRFAEATRQMFLRSDFLTPWFNGVPRFEKPILLYWAQAAGYVVFGDSELAARLPAALAGYGVALLTFLLARGALGDRAALLGALSLATTFRFISYARQGLTDIPVVFFIVLAIWCWYHAAEEDGRPAYAIAGWAALGLGVLTKGPVGLLALAVWVVYLAATRRLLPGLRALEPALGLLAFAAVVLPWNLYMWQAHGRAWLDFALGYEVVTRVTTSGVFAPGREPWWYVQVWLGDAAPWSVFFFAALVTLAVSWRSRALHERRVLLLALVWFGVVLVAFSLSRNKIAHYILPLYPAQAIIVGWFLDRAIARDAAIRMPTWLVPVAATAVAMLALGGLVAAFLSRAFGVPWWGHEMIAPTALATGGLATVACEYRGRRACSALAMIAGLAVAFTSLAVDAAPRHLQRYQPIRSLGMLAREVVPSGERVGYYGRLGGPGFIYYSHHNIEFLDSHDALVEFLSTPGRYVVLPEDDVEPIAARVPGLRVLSRQPFLNVRLKSLMADRPMLDGRVVVLAVVGDDGR